MKHLADNNYNQNKLTNVPDAVDAQDAVNKGQLDRKSDKSDLISQLRQPTFAGHRGGFAVFAEESMESFIKCMESGFIPEMDIHRLSTGEFVVIHDSTVDRTMSGTGNVSSKTAEDWSSMYITAVKPSDDVRRPRAVFLEDVLDKIAPHIVISTELKITGTNNLDAFADLVKSKGMEGNVIIQSNNFDSCAYLAAAGFSTWYLPGLNYPDWVYSPSDIANAGIAYVQMNRGATSSDHATLHALGVKTCVSLVLSDGRAGALAQLSKNPHILMSDDPWLQSGIGSGQDIHNNSKYAYETEKVLDLNDYTNTGTYVFASSNTIANSPSGINGALQVISNAEAGVTTFVKQIWYRWGTPGTNDWETFVRTRSSGTWSGWREIMPRWTDYTPTFSGWSSVSTYVARYILIGDMCTVYIDISSATSNAAATLISLPFTADTSMAPVRSFSSNYNGAEDTIGVFRIEPDLPGSISSRRGSATGPFTQWATSGTKLIRGATISYKVAS